jgi:hypothetical protein
MGAPYEAPVGAARRTAITRSHPIRRLRGLRGLPVLAVGLAIVALTPSLTAATTPPLTLGAWAGQPWEPSKLNAFASLLGGQPHLYMTYAGWDRPFYASDERTIANLGASHVLTWEPWGMTLKSIASGQHDTFVRAWAKGAAAWGKTIYLRPMHEMNGDWYPWGRGVGGNTAYDFRAAWRHIHDVFVSVGATNVKWVWSPNVRYGTNYPLSDLYPGAGYVDWVALDGYNWGKDPHLGVPTWQSFESIFGATYREVIALAPGKPMMIGETASTENGGSKSTWIRQTMLTDIPKYPVVKALIWFNQVDGRSDFRINSSSTALTAFKDVYRSSLWSGRMP